eukprot:scaffold2004_cov101-Cylindrotheca_fusiformis.AAC.2
MASKQGVPLVVNLAGVAVIAVVFIMRRKRRPRLSRIVVGQQMQPLPVTRMCFYCRKEGRELPLERFTTTPCCGYRMCVDCRWKHQEFCGECLTEYPQFDSRALVEVNIRFSDTCRYKENLYYLLGRIYLNGPFTCFGEVGLLTIYEPVRPELLLDEFMNPSDPNTAIIYLEKAAKEDYIPAMLVLGDIYDIRMNDCRTAEEWYQRALGDGKQFSPIAFTRYGLFLRSQGRLEEAMAAFRVAAECDHARGQFEYATMLLEKGQNIRLDWVQKALLILNPREARKRKRDEQVEAVKWLCSASEHRYYFPALTLLAKTLIDVAEEMHNGRADLVGRSPLPRAYQMLKLAHEASGDFIGHGHPKERIAGQQEIKKQLSRYASVGQRCSNCGERGTVDDPLLNCECCGILFYCSKICRKKHYRDGHWADCCSTSELFRFDRIERTLRYNVKDGRIFQEGALSVKGMSINVGQDGQDFVTKRSLRRMVDDFTDQVMDGEDEDYDAEHLCRLMLKMRKNLEIYLTKHLQDGGKGILRQRIQTFAKKITPTADFVASMDAIRILGNKAAHTDEGAVPQLDKEECREALENFIFHLQAFDLKEHSSVEESGVDAKHQQPFQNQDDALSRNEETSTNPAPISPPETFAKGDRELQSLAAAQQEEKADTCANTATAQKGVDLFGTEKEATIQQQPENSKTAIVETKPGMERKEIDKGPQGLENVIAANSSAFENASQPDEKEAVNSPGKLGKKRKKNKKKKRKGTCANAATAQEGVDLLGTEKEATIQQQPESKTAIVETKPGMERKEIDKGPQGLENVIVANSSAFESASQPDEKEAVNSPAKLGKKRKKNKTKKRKGKAE